MFVALEFFDPKSLALSKFSKIVHFFPLQKLESAFTEPIPILLKPLRMMLAAP